MRPLSDGQNDRKGHGNKGQGREALWSKEEEEKKKSGKTMPEKDNAHDLDFKITSENVYFYF